jgi:hypothetical protein
MDTPLPNDGWEINAGSLLAVDLGLRAGLACFGADGRLRWFRSHNFGTTERLRRGVASIIAEIPDCAAIIIEGGGRLARPWLLAAERRSIPVRLIEAGTWRSGLMPSRQRRSGVQAKKQAGALARAVIAWSGLSQPKALRHDAAEAILTGYSVIAASGRFAGLPIPILGDEANTNRS